MHIQPYLFFDGRADEAIEFYKKALGAKVDDADALEGQPPTSRCARPATPTR